MSSSFRKGHTVQAAVIAGLGLGSCIADVEAAQTYVQPQAELRAETNSNLTLDPDGSEDGNDQGYIAELQALMGIATPQSDTSIRPRLRFQEYPDRDERSRLEGFLDLVSRYRWERARFDFLGKYSQQDSYNFDTRSGDFDPLDPNAGSDQGTGRILLDQTRSEFDLRPRFEYDLDERMSVGVDARYRSVWYDAESGEPQNIDYDFAAVGADLKRKLDQRNTIGIGAFANTYDPKRGAGDSDGYGIGLGYEHLWSELAGLEVTVFYETNEPKYDQPGVSGGSSSGFGGSIAAYGEGEVSRWRFFATQRFAPNANGSVKDFTQVRLEYDRSLSERLGLLGVVRYESESEIEDTRDAANVETARADLNVRWLITQTWYLRAGYSYIWRDQEQAAGDAYNNRFSVAIGYRGLRRERR